MLNSVGERTPPLSGCMVSICSVGCVALDVVCDELNDYAWNICL